MITSEQKEVLAVLAAAVKDKMTAMMQPLIDDNRKLVARVEHLESLHPVSGKDGADGKDGKDFDPAEWTDFILRSVADEVARLPEPADGKDGKDGANGVSVDTQTVLSMIEPQVKEFLEKIPLPKDGRDGADGKDGTSVSLKDVHVWICNSIQEITDKWERPKNGAPGERGERGEPGKDGKDMTNDDILTAAAGWVAKHFEDNPPKNGEDGRDGVDGKSVTVEDITPTLCSMVLDAVKKLPVAVSVVGAVIDRDGGLCLVMSDGETKRLGVVVGRDGTNGERGEKGEPGKDGKDGFDGLGVKDFTVSWDGDKCLVLEWTNDTKSEKIFVEIPLMLYRGTWKEGVFKRGDTTTREGSLWVALRETDKMPGTVDSGWQLAVKRGREGKPGRDGADGKAGTPGHDGRDMTEYGMTPDGVGRNG